MLGDVGNAAFELGGALLIWLNVRQLLRDRQIRGVFWPVNLFYTLWGMWNLYYYPSLGQWLSFYAGLGVVLGNAAWCALAWRFRGR